MVKDLTDPTNRDSVPAILTPGEYVLNKEATQMYGPIIEQMNNHGLQQRHTKNQQALNYGGVAGYNAGGIVGFIKQEEGFRNKAYKDPVGIWTIGYGRTTNPDGSRIKPGQTTSRDAEDSWITKRVDQERAAVKQYAEEKGYDWNEGQVDALASFRYNGGHGMLEKLTGGGKRSNDQIGSKILQYNKGRVGGELKELGGLTKRRKAEAGMFTGGKAPSREAPAKAPVRKQEQGPQVPAPQQAPPTPAPEVEQKEAPGLGLAGMLAESIPLQQAPIGHQTSRKFTQAAYIPSSAQQRGPVTSMRKKPQQLNAGGWLDWRGLDGQGHTLGQKLGVQPGVWWDEEEQKKRAAALQARPGIRPGQPVPQMSVPALQAPPPGSDEAILQSSSDSQVDQQPPAPPGAGTQLEGTPFAGYESYTPEEFQQEAELINNPGAQLEGYDVPGLSTPTAESANLAIPEPDPTVGQDPVDPSSFTDHQFTTPDVDATAPGPDELDPRGDQTRPPETESAPVVQQKIEEVVSQDPEAGSFQPPDGVEDAITKGSTVASQNPSALDKVGGMLKNLFGDLFDKDELKRMGVLALGALATGASPQGALAFAGKNYLARVDAKHANQAKLESDLIKGGKYTTNSIKEYMKSQDPSVLQPTEAVGGYKELGNQKEFYGPQGNRVLAREVEDANGSKHWVGPNGAPISLNQYHQDATRVKGTPEYRDRVSKDSKAMTDLVSGLQKQNAFKDKHGNTSYPTDLVPEKAGGNIAKWAIENNVDPAEMSNIVSAAYDQAVLESKDGKKVKNIEAYLNDQYIRATTGSADLFDGASAEKLNTFINSISGYAGLTGSVTKKSQMIIGEFKPDWLALSPDVRKQWNSKAGKGQSGFMLWLQNEMAKEL